MNTEQIARLQYLGREYDEGNGFLTGADQLFLLPLRRKLDRVGARLSLSELQAETLGNIYNRIVERRSPRLGCPVADCGAPLRPGHLMCLDHWQRIPKGLQAEITDNWNKLQGGDCGIASLAEVRGSYVAARDAAIAHLAVDTVGSEA